MKYTVENWDQHKADLDWKKLPAKLQDMKAEVELIHQFYHTDKESKELFDSFLKQVNTALVEGESKGHDKPKPSKAKAKETKAKAQPSIKQHKPAAKKTHPKKETIKTLKVSSVSKVSKAPVEVKRFSPVLQVIRSFLLLDGKQKKRESLLHLLTKAESLHSSDHHKTIHEIITKLKAGIAAMDSSSQDHAHVNIERSFGIECKQIIKSASVELRVNYLAGIEKKK